MHALLRPHARRLQQQRITEHFEIGSKKLLDDADDVVVQAEISK